MVQKRRKSSVINNNDPENNAINDVSKCLRHVLEDLPNKPFFGYESEREQLRCMVERVASFGEANSALLLGERSVGKSHMISSVLNEITSGGGSLITVHLNGLIQTDDKLALREISKQLELDNVVGEKVFGSYASHLQFLLSNLSGKSRKRCPVLFILEEFDLFTSHHNQTLLYNLLDLTTSNSTPLCIIGVTSKVDVVERLEKRVKSRFGHRIIHMLSPSAICPAYLGFLCHFLSISSVLSRDALLWNELLSAENISRNSMFMTAMEKIFFVCRNVGYLKHILHLSLSQIISKSELLEPSNVLDQLAVKMDYVLQCYVEPGLSGSTTGHSDGMIPSDSLECIIQGLSILDMGVLIACNVLHSIHDETDGRTSFNFEMVFTEYMKFVGRKSANNMLVSDKQAVMKSWQQLISLNLIHTVESSSNSGASGGGGGSCKVQNEYRMHSLVPIASEVESICLNGYHNLPIDMKDWVRTNIVAS